jgi:hypothetical protein
MHDPSQHIHFEGPVLVARPGSDLGFLTERKLGLNRTELLEARKERRKTLYAMAEAAAKKTAIPSKRQPPRSGQKAAELE